MKTVGNKLFQKRAEDFVCEQCGKTVIGDGYTNHCPYCLFGKHVDVFPGDRLETCGGLMEPVGHEKLHGQEKLIHRCLRCGKMRKNKVQSADSFEALLALAKKNIAKR